MGVCLRVFNFVQVFLHMDTCVALTKADKTQVSNQGKLWHHRCLLLIEATKPNLFSTHACCKCQAGVTNEFVSCCNLEITSSLQVLLSK